MPPPSSVILLVDNDADDIFLFRRALQRAGVEQEIRVLNDGEEAVAYLAGAGRYADRDAHPLPCLVLLDLKLPKKNGLEVLAWVRAHEEFQDLPIVMVTSSDEPRDREEARRHRVEAYLVKPVEVADLARLAAGIRREAEEHCEDLRPCEPEEPRAG